MKYLLIFCLLTACSKNTNAPPTVQTGQPGPPGADAKITSALYCNASETINGKKFNFAFQSILFSTGVRYLTCSTGWVTQSTANYYYAATSAAPLVCQVTYSVPGNTSGVWRFVENAPDLTVTYNDPGDSTDGHVYKFESTECHE